MLREALDFIFTRADEAANPKPIVRKVNPRLRKVYYAGIAEDEEVDRPLAKHKLNTIDSLARFAENFGQDPSVLYLAEDGIKLVLDDADRQEMAWMGFEYSPQFTAMMGLQNGLSQKALVRTLRTVMAGCVRNDDIIKIIRQIEFDVNRGSRSAVSHTQESMGRSIEKQVRAQAGELPEEIRFVLPMFSTPADVNTDIELVLAVEIEMEAEKIALTPTGNSLQRERQRVMGEIFHKLESVMPEKVVIVEGSVSIASS